MEEEISLREIIETLWDGKWLITVITAVAVAISGIVSFFVLEPVYEARTTIMVSSNVPSDQPQQIQLQKYVEQVKNHAIMGGVIKQLQLNKEEMTINTLRDKIRAEIVKDTNLIRIYVTDNDPRRATEMANTFTNMFIQFMFLQAKEQLKKSYVFTLEQLEYNLNVNKSALTKVEEELSRTPEILTTNKSLSNDAFLNSVVSEQQNKSNTQSGVLQFIDEEVNPVYISLQQTAKNLQVEISKLESERAEILERIDQGNYVAKEDTILVSSAIEPENPVGPKKMLNIALAGVVGVMLSVFVVFIRQYWISTSSNISTEQRIQTDDSISI